MGWASLALHGNLAVVGLSQPRARPSPACRWKKRRTGMPGAILHWLSMEGILHELYGVAGLPGIRRPRVIGLKTQIRRVLDHRALVNAPGGSASKKIPAWR